MPLFFVAGRWLAYPGEFSFVRSRRCWIPVADCVCVAFGDSGQAGGKGFVRPDMK